jgi:hypothetical protein
MRIFLDRPSVRPAECKRWPCVRRSPTSARVIGAIHNRRTRVNRYRGRSGGHDHHSDQEYEKLLHGDLLATARIAERAKHAQSIGHHRRALLFATEVSKRPSASLNVSRQRLRTPKVAFSVRQVPTCNHFSDWAPIMSRVLLTGVSKKAPRRPCHRPPLALGAFLRSSRDCAAIS